MTPGLLAKRPPFPEDSATHPSTNPAFALHPHPPTPRVSQRPLCQGG